MIETAVSKPDEMKTMMAQIALARQKEGLDRRPPLPEDKQEEPEKNTAIDPAKLLESFEMTTDYVDRLGKEEFLIADYLIRRHILTVIAMSGGAKTTYNYFHAAPKLARKGLKVWYIDADSPASDHKLMKTVADEAGFRLLNPDVNAGTTMDSLLATLKKIAESDTDLSDWVLFFDTLKKCADLMSKGSVKEFYRLARKLANLGASIVLLGHANKFRDKEGNLVFEGVGDLRSDTDELIYFERTTDPGGGINVTTVVDPDRGAKVRGIFKPFSFHVSEDREITFHEKPLPPIDRTATAAPRATDDEIVETARLYLFQRGEPVLQKHLVQYSSDMTSAGVKRVRQILVQHAEPKDSLTRAGRPFVYTVGDKNSHYYELPGQDGKSSLAGDDE